MDPMPVLVRTLGEWEDLEESANTSCQVNARDQIADLGWYSITVALSFQLANLFDLVTILIEYFVDTGSVESALKEINANSCIGSHPIWIIVCSQ